MSSPSSPASKAKAKLNPKGQVAVKAFFKSLLQQPQGVAGAVGAAAEAEGAVSKRSSMRVRKDAEMELKRMSEAAQAKQAKQEGVEQKE